MHVCVCACACVRVCVCACVCVFLLASIKERVGNLKRRQFDERSQEKVLNILNSSLIHSKNVFTREQLGRRGRRCRVG